MLLAAAHLYGIAATPEERNLTLEAFLVHARALRDFLGWSNNPNDVIASDFVQRMPRTSMPYLRSKTSRDRLNRMLAHISYSRRRMGRDWQIHEIIREVTLAFRLFLIRLREEHPRQVAWFETGVLLLKMEFPARGA